MMNDNCRVHILSYPTIGQMRFHENDEWATVYISFHGISNVSGMTAVLGTEGGTIAPFRFEFDGPRMQGYGRLVARRLWNHMVENGWIPKGSYEMENAPS